MRRLIGFENGKPVYKNVNWNEHIDGCKKCQEVDLDKSSSFVLACAEGSQLLSEFLINLQRPIQKEKEAKIREWARKAGVFKGA